MQSNVRRKMGRHIGTCKKNLQLIDQESVEILANTPNDEPDFNNCVDTTNDVFDHVDPTVDDGVSFSVEANMNDKGDIIHQSVTTSQLTYDSLPLPTYGVLATDNYVKMELEMYHNHNECLGGYRSVCWRSRYRHDLFGLDNMFAIDDSKFMLYVTSLMRHNTETTNNTLYKLLGAIEKRHNLCYMRDTVVIPTDSRTANKYVLKGKYAIMDNLPRPKTYLIAGHACFRVADVLSLHMALGRSMEFTVIPASEAIDENRPARIREEIHGCEAMDELLSLMNTLNWDDKDPSDSFFGYTIPWHDAFLRSYVKQKMNNVWLYIVSFPESRVSATSPYHTYCVAVGSGHLDHTPVIDWFSAEVESLMKGHHVYCGRRRRVIHVKLGVVANLADHPEKASTVKTALLGTYGKTASWAMDVNPRVLPDCDICYAKRLDSVIADGLQSPCMDGCGMCCQWNLQSNSSALKKIKPPEHYPRRTEDEAPIAPLGRATGITHILPVKQDFEWLVQALNYAAYHVDRGLWNKGNMEAYLRTCAMSKRVRDQLWAFVKKGSPEEMIESIDGEIDTGHAPIMTSATSYMPKIWHSRLTINSFIDCAMHLIFHGVLATLVEVIDAFMTDQKLGSAMEKTINPFMLELQSLRLEWCHAKPLPKKQWLAKNELALARILPFVYTTCFNHVKLPARTNVNDQVLPFLYRTIHALHLLICVLMSPRGITEREVDNAVKLFLSCCHQFSKSYWKDSVDPFWSTKGNYPTLLCLPFQQRRHGQVRWYWEGTSERFIQTLKKELVSMRRTPEYFGKKMCNLFQKNVLEWENERLFKGDPLNKIVTRKNRMYYHYKTRAEVESRFSEGQVISAVMCVEPGTNVILIAYGSQRRSGNVSTVRVRRRQRGSNVSAMGMLYLMFEMEDSDSEDERWDVRELEEATKAHCLLLPHVLPNDDFAKQFAVVYDDWDVEGLDGKRNMRPCNSMMSN